MLMTTMVAVVGVGVVAALLLRNEERRDGVAVGGGVVELPLCGRRLFFFAQNTKKLETRAQK
jgi:hypothetical protein